MVMKKYARYSEAATERRRAAAKERVAQWRKDNPEKYREQWLRYQRANKVKIYAKNKEMRQKHRERYREYSYRSNLKKTHKMSVAEYNALFDSQGRVCAICKRSPEDVGEKFHVDHDHKTNRRRGVLCPRCNHGLGHFFDRPDLLLQAAKYLE